MVAEREDEDQDDCDGNQAKIIAGEVGGESLGFAYFNDYLRRECDMVMIAGPCRNAALPDELDARSPYVIRVRQSIQEKIQEKIFVVVPERWDENPGARLLAVFEVRNGDQPDIHFLKEALRANIVQGELYFGGCGPDTSEGAIVALYQGQYRIAD